MKLKYFFLFISFLILFNCTTPKNDVGGGSGFGSRFCSGGTRGLACCLGLACWWWLAHWWSRFWVAGPGCWGSRSVHPPRPRDLRAYFCGVVVRNTVGVLGQVDYQGSISCELERGRRGVCCAVDGYGLLLGRL